MKVRSLRNGMVLLLVCVVAGTALAQRGPGRGPGRGRGGHGQGQAHDRDHQDFRFLLMNHQKIKRTVEELPNGVKTLTESSDPQVAAKIKEHVYWMKERIEKKEPIRMRDPLFAELFKHADQIKMSYEKTANGVRVTETSANPYVAQLIKAHAKAVSGFVKRGFPEAMKNHPVPNLKQTSQAEKIKYLNPVIKQYGKVVPLPDAAQQPRDESKICVDLTKGGEANKLNPGIEKVARYLNIYQGAGKSPATVQIAIVLHGDATLCVLNDDVYSQRFETEGNPNLELLHELHEAGVEIYVCGQSLVSKGGKPTEVVVFTDVAVSALTSLVNLQTDGYAYVPLLK
ncbi:DsrE family protein [Gimesia fumaroli]|uniref:DsrE/DsrF-like family protein n=1 Tax=Gimesia fumaroli TaxID=2527976 RepID=A0A518IDF6_9PLAN|nr:DsrE family protein [Gimesia fumaroli]QDV51136.1 DsrE/DsrF-like family protein [Gimesia fumaroli]